MIRVVLTSSTILGRACWKVEGLDLLGTWSRQSLLDACRAISRMGAVPSDYAGLFQRGRSEPDLTCSIKWGAEHSVEEGGRIGPRFTKFKAFPGL